MLITNQTTVKDVEGHPFIGIADMPMFMHIDLNEVTTYNPLNFEPSVRVIMESKPISVECFRGDYQLLVEDTKGKGGMVYFYPDSDGKIVHKDSIGEYVRMAKVKLSNYHFNQKLNEIVKKLTKPEIIEKNIEKNYKYILIRR